MSTMPTATRRLKIEESAAFVDAIANEKRLQILTILINSEMSVGNLSAMIGLSQSALSQHLAKLRGVKLVTTRRDAQTVYYSCRSEPVYRVLTLLSEFFDEPAEQQLRQA